MNFESQRDFPLSSVLATGCQPKPGLAPSNSTIVPVVLSGGSGRRLWPLSTEEAPKQFLPLLGPQSLFEQALVRVSDRQRYHAAVIVASERHARICEQVLPADDHSARLILETHARNTAAAIIMAAAEIRHLHGDDALLLVIPSDHVISDAGAFHEAVATGEAAAREGWLVTFGVRPTGPETGYGYLQMGSALTSVTGVKKVARFVEKPPLEQAERMVADGNHLWNAGIFLFRADSFLDEATRLVPEIASAATAAVARGERSSRRILAHPPTLKECPSQSVDYAVMERSNRVAVVPMAAGWSDLGSWDALTRLAGGDAVTGPVLAVDCGGCHIQSDGVEVAAVGLRDIMIIASGNRVVVMPRGHSLEANASDAINGLRKHG